MSPGGSPVPSLMPSHISVLSVSLGEILKTHIAHWCLRTVCGSPMPPSVTRVCRSWGCPPTLALSTHREALPLPQGRQEAEPGQSLHIFISCPAQPAPQPLVELGLSHAL